jgi:hypothetical protein
MQVVFKGLANQTGAFAEIEIEIIGKFKGRVSLLWQVAVQEDEEDEEQIHFELANKDTMKYEGEFIRFDIGVNGNYFILQNGKQDIIGCIHEMFGKHGESINKTFKYP